MFRASPAHHQGVELYKNKYIQLHIIIKNLLQGGGGETKKYIFFLSLI